MIPDSGSHRKEFLSLLLTVEVHDELHITGHHGTRTVKILEVLQQMQTPQKAHSLFGKTKSLHKLSEAEKPLYVGRAIRHIMQQHAEHLGKIDSVRLQKIAPQKESRAAPAAHQRVPLQFHGQPGAQAEPIDLTDEALALANMSDKDFGDFLKELADEQVASLKGTQTAEEKQHRPMGEVVKQQSKNLAKEFKKSGLTLAAILNQQPGHLPVKLAARMMALAIFENALAERRAEAKREEKEQIENHELKREILKSEILKYDISRQDMEGAIIEALLENRDEEQKASEEDLRAVAKALVDLVWLGLPKAFIAGI